MKNIILKIPTPRDNSYLERLRFWCQSADPSDPALFFMVNMWSYCIAVGDPTGAKKRSVDAYLKEVDEKYLKGGSDENKRCV